MTSNSGDKMINESITMSSLADDSVAMVRNSEYGRQKSWPKGTLIDDIGATLTGGPAQRITSGDYEPMPEESTTSGDYERTTSGDYESAHAQRMTSGDYESAALSDSQWPTTWTLTSSTASSCSQRVVINISGLRFETCLRTLNRYPNTLLGSPMRRMEFWDESRDEFFFDRNRPSFDAILDFYQTGGKINRPLCVPLDVFYEELKFFDLGEEALSRLRRNEGYLDKAEETVLPNNVILRHLWLLFECPDSSIAARVVASLSVWFIVVSLAVLCLESIPSWKPKHVTKSSLEDLLKAFHEPFFLTESICIGWFLIEFLIRAISCPSKRKFFSQAMNIIDLLAILPYFIEILVIIVVDWLGMWSDKIEAVFRVARLVRVFRIFKLTRHSAAMKVLAKTLQSSLGELALLSFFLVLATLLFSTCVYLVEEGKEDSDFESIPSAFWWTIVTMVTVGYGDMIPKTPGGKVIGTVCTIAGVLALALPVPVIVANFTRFYHTQGNIEDLGGNTAKKEKLKSGFQKLSP
ncbi:shaker-related potassium channel tsha2-like [Branchiostoma floridae]|uniref:Shaker-related potassium channel tsha2-like n=1 Tax=Branchiostoma floridae TaxID=7739 RepID=A0A9J7HI61_BRAFL|nr:shaker-related potassium channel tsha2-like [Branchiostoma floridae]XP_035660100.1 shaker-related potassium channel tsha2-like [Branchiostoma floridae]